MNCLVKVGRASKIKVRNCNVIRAITYSEMKKQLSKGEIDIVVIEDALNKDLDRLIDGLGQYELSRVVLFNCECNLDGAVSTRNLSRVHDYISSVTGVDVRTYDTVKTEIDEEVNERAKVVVEASDNFRSDNLQSEEHEIEADIAENRDVEHEITDIKGLGNIKNSAEIEYYEKQLEIANEKVIYYKNLSENVKSDLETLDKRLKEILTTEEVLEYSRSSGEERELTSRVQELQAYKDKYDALEVQLKDLREQLSSTGVENDELKAESIKLNDELTFEVDSRLEMCRVVKEVCWEAWQIEEEYSNKCKELGELMSKLKESEDRYSELDKRCKEIEKLGIENEGVLTSQIEQLSNQLTDVTDELESTSARLEAQKESASSYVDQIEQLTDELEELKLTVERNNQEIVERNNELARFKVIDIEDMEETIRSLQESNATLAGEIGKHKRERDEYERQLEDAKIGLANMKKYNDSVNTTAKALARSADAGEIIRINCDYSGKAFIIQVFGSGSYGVTSLAQAIANSLDGRILVMDFDIVNPKMDNWYGVNPIVRDLVEISSEMKKTGLGALLEKDVDYVIENKDRLIRTVRQHKNGRTVVDYFSGSYSKVDMFKLMSVNFTEFFTYFGNCYDFIVVDSGRLGGSEISNALTRMISNISWKNVVVTLHQAADCRTMALRLSAEAIKGDKAVWVMNMAKDNVMNQIMKKSIGYAADHCTIGFDKGVYGDICDLDSVGTLRRDIKRMVDTIVR